ncbi:hypothetical protein QYF61_000143 [Mycteria americana]|uniref:Uncharacterized protein n=1 Tax=Mycteria americana TaxID=33587 RepID=A0AAN7NGK3_MYCAM|nr:hypothetical protein QYF61_000143 [Mycteria americana]
MWCSGTWFSGGLASVRFTVGLNDLKDERRAVDVIYFGFSKVFNCFPQHTSVQVRMYYIRDRVVVNGLHSTWRLVTRGVPKGSLCWDLSHLTCLSVPWEGNGMLTHKVCNDTKSPVGAGGRLIQSREGLPFRDT